jgi:hypothetical protein
MSAGLGTQNVFVVIETLSTADTHANRPASAHPLMDASIVLVVAAVVWALSQWLGGLRGPHGAHRRR